MQERTKCGLEKHTLRILIKDIQNQLDNIDRDMDFKRSESNQMRYNIYRDSLDSVQKGLIRKLFGTESDGCLRV